MKKILSVLALSATLLVGCSGVVNSKNPINESAFDGLNNATAQLLVKAGQIGSDNEFDHSKTYVQYGKNDDGDYVIRFATAIKGDIASLSYTRAAVGELSEATFNVTTVYKGIEANGSVYYYDGTDLTTSVEYAGNYYWACYSIAFGTKAYYETEFDVTFAVDGANTTTKKSSLTDICTDCEVVGHNYVRKGTLKATSLTKGSINQVCGNCGYQDIQETDYDESNAGYIESSGEDKELNSIDVIRGLAGDFELNFKYTHTVVNTGVAWSDWMVARVTLLASDTVEYAGETSDIYGRTFPAPLNGGTTNGAKLVGYSDGAQNSWLNKGDGPNGKYETYAGKMDIDAKVVRDGDFVHVYLDGQSLVDKDYSNHNEFHFYIPSSTTNIVIASTYSQITIKESSLVLLDGKAKTTTELVEEPVSVLADGAGYTYEVPVHQTVLQGERVRATYKFNVKRKPTTDANGKISYGSNQWGTWRACVWGNHKLDSNNKPLSPHPYNTNSTNGVLFSRITPLDSDIYNWNSSKNFIRDSYSWFTSPITNKGGFDYTALMSDCDVTLTIDKIGAYYVLSAAMVTNYTTDPVKGIDSTGAYASKMHASRVPAEAIDSISVSVDTEQCDLTVTSCVVEVF